MCEPIEEVVERENATYGDISQLQRGEGVVEVHLHRCGALRQLVYGLHVRAACAHVSDLLIHISSEKKTCESREINPAFCV